MTWTALSINLEILLKECLVRALEHESHIFSQTVTIMYSAFPHSTHYRSSPNNFCLKPQLVVELQCTFRKTCSYDLTYIKLIASFGNLFHWLIALPAQKFPVWKLLTLAAAIQSSYMWPFFFFFKKKKVFLP